MVKLITFSQVDKHTMGSILQVRRGRTDLCWLHDVRADRWEPVAGAWLSPQLPQHQGAPPEVREAAPGYYYWCFIIIIIIFIIIIIRWPPTCAAQSSWSIPSTTRWPRVLIKHFCQDSKMFLLIKHFFLLLFLRFWLVLVFRIWVCFLAPSGAQ